MFPTIPPDDPCCSHLLTVPRIQSLIYTFDSLMFVICTCNFMDCLFATHATLKFQLCAPKYIVYSVCNSIFDTLWRFQMEKLFYIWRFTLAVCNFIASVALLGHEMFLIIRLVCSHNWSSISSSSLGQDIFVISEAVYLFFLIIYPVYPYYDCASIPLLSLVKYIVLLFGAAYFPHWASISFSSMGWYIVLIFRSVYLSHQWVGLSFSSMG